VISADEPCYSPLSNVFGNIWIFDWIITIESWGLSPNCFFYYRIFPNRDVLNLRICFMGSLMWSFIDDSIFRCSYDYLTCWFFCFFQENYSGSSKICLWFYFSSIISEITFLHTTVYNIYNTLYTNLSLQKLSQQNSLRKL
jgi:uncharacterized membrane protein YhdT